MKQAIFAGSFYPSSKKDCLQFIHDFSAPITIPTCSKKPLAIVAPHAGYVYSGKVAAHAFKSIQDFSYKRALILGPSHRYHFNGVSFLSEDSYETPLGAVEIDQDCVLALTRESEMFSNDSQAYSNEHSIEVELPFLKSCFPSLPIVPIVIGRYSPSILHDLATAIIRHCKREETLLVVSTDLSHFYPSDIAEKMDKKAIDIMLRQDSDELERESRKESIQLCGLGAMLAVLEVLKTWRCETVDYLSYCHSGDQSGDNSRVVGYSALRYS
ncbi:AmmeMemoRadiSam system protein B [Candidatus Marinamargulisbacteria bacterium SCGC AG-343-D04]|nr:AmmeMemoRadiSam system protein B [Candidatus Marinamargulisbacteria bacterium SCGC AG-343-D04]